MQAPTSPIPFDISFKTYEVKFGKVDDIGKLETVLSAARRDAARHTVEWFEYYLHLAKQYQETLERLNAFEEAR